MWADTCSLKAINFEVAVEVAKCVNSSSLDCTESRHPFWRKLIPTGRLGGDHWIPRWKTKSKSRELVGGTSFAERGPEREPKMLGITCLSAVGSSF